MLFCLPATFIQFWTYLHMLNIIDFLLYRRFKVFSNMYTFIIDNVAPPTVAISTARRSCIVSNAFSHVV